MLTDSREYVRELAVRRIIKARQNKQPSTRIFKIPKLNFSALDYIDLIEWREYCVTEPPITMSKSYEELKEMVHSKIQHLGQFPCHTQAVERCVKVITNASSKVCGGLARDGFIRAKMEAPKDLPSFDNKAQYFAIRRK